MNHVFHIEELSFVTFVVIVFHFHNYEDNHILCVYVSRLILIHCHHINELTDIDSDVLFNHHIFFNCL